MVDFWTADGQAAGSFSNASAPLQLGAEVGQEGFDLFQALLRAAHSNSAAGGYTGHSRILSLYFRFL